MSEEIIEKADKLMYALIKEAARHSFVEFLEEWDLSEDDYEDIKSYITEKTGIEFKYL